MAEKIIAVFPGQGAQVVGMGQDFYQQSDKAKAMFAEADEALGFSLSKLCFEGPIEELTLTANVQPAILTVSCIAYELAKESLGEKLQPQVAAGHSLGEYSAYVAANSIKFSDAVKLVRARGEFMQSAVAIGTGAMLAILGQEVADLEAALTDYQNLEIANINAPGQIVVSGSAEDAEKFKAAHTNVKIIPLTVSAPFHCKLMQPAQEKLAKVLATTEISTPAFPVICNYQAKPLTNTEEIRECLEKQVTGRVRWVESMEKAKVDFGVDAIYEFGPGKVLTGLMKRIDKSLTRCNFQKSTDLEL